MRNRALVLFVMLVIMGVSKLPGSAQQKSTENSLTLSPLETQVMGQNRWLRGGPAALRVIVLDHETGKPVRAEVRLLLERQENGKPSGAPEPLFAGHTNGLGTLDAQFTAPDA